MMFDPYDIFAGFGSTEIDIWSIGAAIVVFVIGVLITLAVGIASFINRDA